jgi:DNA polymerase-3 subunit alpha
VSDLYAFECAVDNLINDLAKVCGLNTIGVDISIKEQNTEVISQIKAMIGGYKNETGSNVDTDALLRDPRAMQFNKRYHNIIKHFAKLFKKTRYIGTHAAGIAITGGNLLDYTAIRLDKDGNMFTSYDLIDVEDINVIKFDILGLKTMESIGELRRLTGNKSFKEEWLTDKKMYDNFREGKCDGVFQYEKGSVRGILKQINCDCFEDLVAASAMNRPGPLSLHMPDSYADNKETGDYENIKYLEYTKESYGTIIYQEQIMQICVYIGGMEWSEADKIIKMMKSTSQKEAELKQQEALGEILFAKFWDGAQKKGFTYDEAKDLYVKMTDSYSFNKGHAVGYALISAEEMHYKMYYPNEYWYAKVRFAKDDAELSKFSATAVADGAVVFLPHVNYSAGCQLRNVEGDNVIQLGMSTLKNVGDKAANFIED